MKIEQNTLNMKTNLNWKAGSTEIRKLIKLIA